MELEGVRGFGLGGLGLLKQSFAVSGKRLQAWGFRVYQTSIHTSEFLCAVFSQGGTG